MELILLEVMALVLLGSRNPTVGVLFRMVTLLLGTVDAVQQPVKACLVVVMIVVRFFAVEWLSRRVVNTVMMMVMGVVWGSSRGYKVITWRLHFEH